MTRPIDGEGGRNAATEHWSMDFRDWAAIDLLHACVGILDAREGQPWPRGLTENNYDAGRLVYAASRDAAERRGWAVWAKRGVQDAVTRLREIGLSDARIQATAYRFDLDLSIRFYEAMMKGEIAA